MKILLTFLLLASPAAAQSINPIAYGQRFCQLRHMGVDIAAARKAAISYSYDSSRNAALMQKDIEAGVDYILVNCHGELN